MSSKATKNGSLRRSNKRGLNRPKKKRRPWDKLVAGFGVALLCILVLQFMLILFLNPQPFAGFLGRSKAVDFPAILSSYYSPSNLSSYPPYYDPPYNPIIRKANDAEENHRSRPVFRSLQQHETIAEQRTILKYIFSQESNHVPCEWPTKLKSSERVIFQNNLPFDRFACGKVVLGEGGTLELSFDEVQNCQERPRVFWKTPSSSHGDAQDMPPIRLARGRFEDEKKIEKLMKPFPNCSVPCHKSDGRDDSVSTLFVEGTNWEFVYSMEAPQYYRKLFLNSTSYQDNRYYAMTSFKSDIPLPYFSWTEYAIQHPPVDFDKAIKGASFLANNCISPSNREQLVINLAKESILGIHSLGQCLHNADPPAGVDMANKTSILERYLFHLAFENQRYDDYVTEKMWGSLSSGTLPIYMGAPNVKDHIPPNSVVFADDFESPSDLAKYLVKLSNDKALYNSFHEWRRKPLDSKFASKYNFTHVHSTCRVCKWAYAKKYGLGWNHAQQEITSLPINRETCRNKKGLIVRPFEESWMSDAAGKTGVAIHSPSDDQTCKLNNANRRIFIDDKSLSRTVYDADGVTDIIAVNKKQANYTLRLKFPIRANGLWPIDKHKSMLQDDTSRITIVTKEEVQLRWSSQDATVAFKIAAASPNNPSISLNIRIIVETIDKFHKGAGKQMNYFGEIMTQDFLNPMNTSIFSSFLYGSR